MDSRYRLEKRCEEIQTNLEKTDRTEPRRSEGDR